MEYEGLSRAPGESMDTPNMYPSAAAGPSHLGPTSYGSPAIGNKAPVNRAAGGGRGRGSGRGKPAVGPPGRLAAPLASSSVVGQRATRSVNRPHVARLKLKFSDKGEVQKVQGGKLTSFLGNYSREADSDPDEPLVFEEQFILRVPDKVVRGDKEKGIKGIKTLLEEKKEVNNASFKFKG
jgi:transcription initiation factor TFIID subunit 7